jgi:hypothetical protein
MLLRMYNDASTARESRTTEPQHAEDSNGNDDNSSSATSTPLVSSGTTYAAELEELLRTEQLNRVALIQQITSEREQVGSAVARVSQRLPNSYHFLEGSLEAASSRSLCRWSHSQTSRAR